MPIYEYRCPECHTVFSERRRISEADEPIACPNCHVEGARRVISLFAAHSADGGTIAGGGGGCSSCASTRSCSTCGTRS